MHVEGSHHIGKAHRKETGRGSLEASSVGSESLPFPPVLRAVLLFPLECPEREQRWHLQHKAHLRLPPSLPPWETRGGGVSIHILSLGIPAGSLSGSCYLSQMSPSRSSGTGGVFHCEGHVRGGGWGNDVTRPRERICPKDARSRRSSQRLSAGNHPGLL